MVTIQLGRKWDMTDCYTLSGETNSFDITSWPRGDHNNANDYSLDGECTESPSTCLAEMVVCVVTYGSGSHSISITMYDPYDRILWAYSASDIWWAYLWLGRFGEKNLLLEVYRPGRYKCVIVHDGLTTTKYFDVYDQTNNKYLHKQGDDYGSGNSWGAAKASYYAAQAALTAGNIIYIGEADYSNETGISFTKTQTLTPVKATWGGFPNISNTANNTTADSGAQLIANVGSPIEMNGTIDRWAYYSNGNSSNTVKLKIYRGGNAGTRSRTTSTLIYTSDAQVVSTSGWKIFTISPAQSVLRGDIIALQNSQCYYNIGLISTSILPYLCGAAAVSGDPADTVFGDANYDNYDIMIRVWNSGTNFEIGLPIY